MPPTVVAPTISFNPLALNFVAQNVSNMAAKTISTMVSENNSELMSNMSVLTINLTKCHKNN